MPNAPSQKQKKSLLGGQAPLNKAILEVSLRFKMI